jgi:hypothetical protein
MSAAHATEKHYAASENRGTLADQHGRKQFYELVETINKDCRAAWRFQLTVRH